MNLIVISHWRVLKLITGEDFEVAEVKKFGNLYLVRHPETSLNVGGCLRGHINIGLTDVGIKQIEDILEQLKDNDAVEVHSSDLKRASTAATRIANEFKLPLFLTEDLRPADIGELTGQSIKDNWRFLQQIDDAGDNGYFPGGESVKQFKDRIHKIFDYLRDK
jgi:broad specificity phosphatase PhoE